tara:strand:- start:158 stop:688 length:531 start_codon:yes stop_codon:yes gene_type:complete
LGLTEHNLNNFITVGKVLKSYGLRGQIKVVVYLEDIKFLQTLKNYFVGHSLIETKINFLKHLKKSIWIAAIAETKTKEQAEGLKGQHIFLEKKFLPTLMTDEFYYQDLKGLQIKIDGSLQKGFVCDVFNFGSGDVLEVSLDDRGSTIYIPFDKDNIGSIDLANRTILLTPIKGLLT